MVRLLRVLKLIRIMKISRLLQRWQQSVDQVPEDILQRSGMRATLLCSHTPAIVAAVVSYSQFSLPYFHNFMIYELLTELVGVSK